MGPGSEAATGPSLSSRGHCCTSQTWPDLSPSPSLSGGCREDGVHNEDQVRNEGPRPVHMPKPMDETPPQMRGPALHISEVKSLLNYSSRGPRADILINQFSILNLYTLRGGGGGERFSRHFTNVNPFDSPNNRTKCKYVCYSL